MGHLGYPWLLLLAVLATLVSMKLLLSRLRQLALDVPNHRSLHEVPVPRTGGWAIWVGVSVAALLGLVPLSFASVVAFGMLLAVSFADDLKPVSARLRFAIQTVAVTLLVADLVADVAWWLWPMLVVGGVWVINLYNFMDGMDGFAGSMSTIGFGALATVSLIRGNVELAVICTLVAVCCMVFLYYNWPPARIFLGDAGSTSIGLAAFAVGVYGWQQGVFTPLVPLIVFAPFWLDATFTLVRRMLAGERWWEAHRQHLYQRAALSIGVARTLKIELLLMLATSGIALALVALGLG